MTKFREKLEAILEQHPSYGLEDKHSLVNLTAVDQILQLISTDIVGEDEPGLPGKGEPVELVFDTLVDAKKSGKLIQTNGRNMLRAEQREKLAQIMKEMKE